VYAGGASEGAVSVKPSKSFNPCVRVDCVIGVVEFAGFRLLGRLELGVTFWATVS